MKTILIAAAAVFALSGSVLADAVTSATGTFSAFPSNFAASTPAWINYSTPPATTGVPFWNNPSGDTGVGGSRLMNPGYLLTDTGGFAGTPPVLGTDTVTQDFTAAGGADPAAFNFLSTASAYNLTLLFAASALDSGNPAQGTVFGYYTGSTFTPVYTPVDTNSPTGATPFNPVASGGSYGFYATVCYGSGLCETYTTGNGNSGNDSSAAGWNHFALFKLASGSYVLGFEDSNSFAGEGLGDFNDVVVELKIQSTPEPATIGMLSLGIAGLGLAYLWSKGTRC